MTSRVVSYAIELHERAGGTTFCTVTRIVRDESGSFTMPELARFECNMFDTVYNDADRARMVRYDAASRAMLVTRSARRRGVLASL